MSDQKKRKLSQFSSQYIRPSKYLILSRDDEDQVDEIDSEIKNVQELKINTSSDLEVKTIKNQLMVIGNDCFMEIIGFLDLESLRQSIFVSKTWAKLIIPYFVELSMIIYDGEEHLERLIEYGQSHDQNSELEGLFTEYATWKERLCYDDSDLESYRPVYGHYSDDEDVIEHEECQFNEKLIPFGSPLCKGTIKEQFEMVQDEIDVESYKKIVEKRLGITEKEQGQYEINPFVFYDKIEHEKKMIDPYLHEVQESISKDSGNFVVFGNSFFFPDDRDHEYKQVECNDFAFFSLRAGIVRLYRRSASLFFEPSVIEDSLYQLKKFIHLMIKDAYESKFPNKTEDLKFEQSHDKYWNSYYRSDYEEELPIPDEDLKLSAEDIMNSFEKLTGNPLYFPVSVTEKMDAEIVRKEDSLIDSDNEEIAMIQIESNNEHDVIAVTGNGDGFSEDESEDISSEDEIEEDEDEEDEEESVEIVTDENFIDDSSCFEFDLENLGDTLPEQLMKVSIRVHEQVYGMERAHKEKLYLKNWYGFGDLFFSNCSKQLENPEQEEEISDEQHETLEGNNDEEDENETLPSTEQFTPIENLSENEQIAKDAKEDVKYFGYSLYEDEFNEFPIWDTETITTLDSGDEKASEEESVQYHLRRMLREQSYECILNYFDSNQ